MKKKLTEIKIYKKDLIKTIPKRFSPILIIKKEKRTGKKLIVKFIDFDGIIYENNGDYVFSFKNEVLKPSKKSLKKGIGGSLVTSRGKSPLK
jgi:maltose-binding protein MalE